MITRPAPDDTGKDGLEEEKKDFCLPLAKNRKRSMKHFGRTRRKKRQKDERKQELNDQSKNCSIFELAKSALGPHKELKRS
mgnify:CR=1 FL=1